MSVERTIANYLLIASEDLDGARVLQSAGNRNAAYLAEQAAEKIIRAVLTSEGIHAGHRHDLRMMVDLMPDANPLKPLLGATTPLAAYATSYRYPTTKRVMPAPAPDVLKSHLDKVERALREALTAFDVDLQDPRPEAGRPDPVR